MAVEELQVVRPGGDAIAVNLAGTVTVLDLRVRIASALGVPVPRTILLSANTVIENGYDTGVSIASLFPDGVVTVVVKSQGPSWYPANKYIHDGKEVLKITWKIKSDYSQQGCFCMVHYVSGGAATKSCRGHCSDDQEKLSEITDFAEDLAKSFGFVIHCTADFCDQPHAVQAYEAVPAEDPDEWEGSTGSMFEGRIEKRKQTPEMLAAEEARKAALVPFFTGNGMYEYEQKKTQELAEELEALRELHLVST